jgi:hypothetical protein
MKNLERELTGYKLYDLGSLYELHSSRGIFRGSLAQVSTYAVLKLGFNIKEIELGVLEMERNFHDGAEYGVRKSFMFTFDKEGKYAKSIVQ